MNVNYIFKELKEKNEIFRFFIHFIEKNSKDFPFKSEREALEVLELIKNNEKLDIFVLKEVVQAKMMGVNDDNIKFLLSFNLSLKEIRYAKWFFLKIPPEIIRKNIKKEAVGEEELLKCLKELIKKEDIKNEINTTIEQLDFSIKHLTLNI